MRKLAASFLGFLLLMGTAPISSQAADLTVKFNAIGNNGYLHPSLAYFELEFSGSAISTSTNCSSFLSSQGKALQVTLKVPGKPEEVGASLASGLKKTVSISRTSLVCDFFFEGWGRDLYYQHPVGSIFGSLPSTSGILGVTNQGGLLASSSATLVNFDNPANHPKLSISSPQRLESIGQHFEVSLEEVNNQLWEFDSARAEICSLSSDCRNPSAELLTDRFKGVWSGGNSLAVMISPNRVLVSSPLGQNQVAIRYNYRINTLPQEYLPSCSMVYEAPCVSATATVLYEAIKEKAPTLQAEDVSKIRDLKQELKVSCPKAISGASFACTVTYESFLGPFPVAEAQSVTFCIWKNWDGDYGDPENCVGQGRVRPTFSQTKSMSSGTKVLFTVPATAFSAYKTLDVIATTPSGEFASSTFVRPAKPAKPLKPMTVRVATSAEVVFGETHSYRITTNPALSGSCKVYRANYGMLSLVATNTLTKGAATGSHRWLWKEPYSTALSLTVECSNSTHAGTGYAIVRAFR